MFGSRESIEKIAKYYALDIHGLFSVSQGYSGLVQGVEGNNGRWVFKRLDPNISNCRIDFFSNVQKIFSDNLLSPKILLTKEYELYAKTKDGNIQITEFIDSKCLIGQEEITPYQLGQCLGDAHKLASRYHNECLAIGHSKFFFIPRDPRADILKLLSFHRTIKGDRVAARVLEVKLQLLDEINRNTFEFSRDCEQRIIHGDISASNLLVSNGSQKLHLIDFDQCCVFFRSYEVMRAAIYLFSPDLFMNENFLIFFKEFLLGYLTKVDLPMPEMDKMFEIYFYIQICDNSFQQITCSTDCAQTREFGMRRFRLLEYLKENQYEIEAMVSGV